MRKTGIRVRLDRGSLGWHERGPIRELVTQQPLHTFLVNGIVDWHVTRDMQGVQRLSRCVGLASRLRRLAPATIRILRGLQNLYERSTLVLSGAGGSQRVQLHAMLFAGISRM